MNVKGYLKHKKQLVIAVSFLLIIIYAIVLSPLFSLISTAKTLPEKIYPIKTALINQDIELLVFELEYFRESLEEIDKDATRLKFLSIIPYYGSYFSDLKTISSLSIDLTNTAIELFSSLNESIPDLNLKFKGWGTSEDLLTEQAQYTNLSEITSIIVEELPNYKGRFQSITQKFNQIDPNKYPKRLGGFEIRQRLKDMQILSSAMINSYDGIVGFAGLIPELLGESSASELFGTTKSQNYLIILQNDKELRPSGGTLTAYAVLTINKGNLKLTKSGDIEIFDSKNNLNLKYASDSPDFKISAENIKQLWSSVAEVPQIHGIIAVDTHFIKSLIDVLGEVKVSNTEKVTSKNADKQLQKFSISTGSHSQKDMEQKNMTTVLLYDLMTKAFTTNSKKAALFKRVLTEVQEKHVLVYLENQNAQKLLEKNNFAGRVREYDNDYIYVVDTNETGDRANLYVNQKVNMTIDIQDSDIKSKVSIEYDNTGEYDEIYNRGYQNYIRIYVPKGSKLINSEGSLKGMIQNEEFGKTYFAGYLEVKPKSKATFTINYQLPNDIISSDEYKLLIQKQPGIDSVAYEIKVGNQVEKFDLSTDKEVTINL